MLRQTDRVEGPEGLCGPRLEGSEGRPGRCCSATAGRVGEHGVVYPPFVSEQSCYMEALLLDYVYVRAICDLPLRQPDAPHPFVFARGVPAIIPRQF